MGKKKRNKKMAKFKMYDCPVCGDSVRVGKVPKAELEPGGDKQYDVRCSDETCLLGNGLGHVYESPDDAVDDWNAGSADMAATRVSLSEVLDTMIAANDAMIDGMDMLTQRLLASEEALEMIEGEFDSLLSLSAEHISSANHENAMLRKAVRALSDIVAPSDDVSGGCEE